MAATRKKKLIPDHDFKHFLPISVLVVAGTFNRPTFPAFAAAPVFFWLQRGVATNSYFTPFQVYQKIQNVDLRTRPEVKIVRYCFLDLQFSRRVTAARLPDHLSILPAFRLSLLRPPYPAQAVAPDHGLVGLEVHTGQLRHVQRRPRQP